MTLQDNLGAQLGARQADPRLSGIIKLAILAVGGQGGGVLTGWIEDLARSNGYAAQATSVAGVAQRTGATVYYVEMAPHRAGDPMPIFSLMPAAAPLADPRARMGGVRVCLGAPPIATLERALGVLADLFGREPRAVI